MPRVKTLKPPKPHSTLQDEGGSTRYWLDADWSFKDIEDEYPWLFEDAPASAATLGEVWYRPRWTTPAERADEDVLYDLCGDYEMTGCDTSVVYEDARPGSPGAVRYWTTEVAPAKSENEVQS